MERFVARRPALQEIDVLQAEKLVSTDGKLSPHKKIKSNSKNNYVIVKDSVKAHFFFFS